MPPKNRVILKSNFRAVRSASDSFREHAIQAATDEMEAEAEKRLERGNNTRGWNLPEDIEQKTSREDGEIRYPHFFGRWFEYGTLHIAPYPFMRPAHRKGRKRLLEEYGDDFEGWIRRRAGMRRR